MMKYIILKCLCSSPNKPYICIFEKILGKLTKIFQIQGGLMDFQDSGGGFIKEGKIQGGVQTPVGTMSENDCFHM